MKYHVNPSTCSENNIHDTLLTVSAQKKRKQQPVKAIPTVSSSKYLALSFLLPFTILGTVFALHGVYPFGSKQILIRDFIHQYYPFLSGLWHKLREGGVSPWSWTAGGGHDYASLLAYYMTSPLNLPALILPHAWMREVLTLTLLVKIGCAGLFTAMYLRYAYKECSSALPIFSSLYALCAFTLGYYYHILWFDCFALLPLCLMGLLALMNEGKFRLYVASLALAVFANFYIGYIICIFVAITFFCQCVIQKLNLRDSLRKLGSVAVCSSLAIGLTAALTIPAWSALQSTYSVQTSPPTLSFFTSFFNILGNFIAFTPPTVERGQPNLYCGMICVLLAGLFMQSRKITLREKIVLAGLLVFLLISLNFNALYLVMHGFRYPDAYPARFSFLVSFVLVVMAYRAFLLTEGIDKRGLLAMGISAALFLLSAVLGSQEKKYIIGSAVLCAFYILLFFILMNVKNVKARTAVKAVFALAVLTELFITSYIGIKTTGTSIRDEYHDRYEIPALLNKRQKTGIDFYRTDTDISYHVFNEPYLYNYDAISFFSSTINPEALRFMQGLGLIVHRLGFNQIYYANTSPLTSAFLNVRYMMSHLGDLRDKNAYWKTVSKAGNSLLLENKYYLPLGFMVDKKLAEYKRQTNSFLSQNDLFSMATGLNGSLFAVYEISALAEKKDGKITWNYPVPVTGMTYAFCMIGAPKTRKEMEIYVNGTALPLFPINDHTLHIFTVGSLERGDNVTFLLDIDDALLYVGHLNGELFEQGYAKLARAPLQLTKFSNTRVCGNVTALEDGLLYTSIPGDKNWSVYVDGAKSKIVLIDNAMIAVSLDKGYHEIEFRYFNTSLLVGIIVCMASLGAFVVMVFWKKRISNFFW